jgi:ferredoxin
MATIWCSHAEREIDQLLCPPPCGAIHVRCTGCGTAVGGCPFEGDGRHERLVAVLGRQLPSAQEWQVRDLAELIERSGHARSVLPLSRALTLVGLPERG